MRLFLYFILSASLIPFGVPAHADPPAPAGAGGAPAGAQAQQQVCTNQNDIEAVKRETTDTWNSAKRGESMAVGGASVAVPSDGVSIANLSRDTANQLSGHFARVQNILEGERRRCRCAPVSNPPPSPQAIEAVERDCEDHVTALVRMADIEKDRYFAHSGRSSLAKKALIAGGVAAAGLGAYMLLKKKKKKDDDEEDKDGDKDAELAEKERAAGIITTADGKKIECFSQANFQKVECEATMLRLCQTDEKKTTGGCNSFNNFRCSGMGEGADSMYCLHTAAEGYCKQPGNLIQSSPACQWSGSRPAECVEDPESIECRMPISAAELDAKCADYPNDPICKVKDRVAVTQPGGAGAGGDGVSTIGANDGSGSGKDGGAANGGNGDVGNQAGNSGGGSGSVDLGDGAGSVDLDSITGNGGSARGTASASSSSGSNLVGTQSALLKSLCSSGQLVGCPN